MLLATVVDEVRCAVALLPLARVNVRAPLRTSISVSDASERGGASAEAMLFLLALSSFLSDRVSNETSVAKEQIGRKRSHKARRFCGVCTVACCGSVCCGPGCSITICSPFFYWVHRKRDCVRILNPLRCVGFVSFGDDPGWTWEVRSNKLEVVKLELGSQRLSIPGVVVVSCALSCCSYFCEVTS